MSNLAIVKHYFRRVAAGTKQSVIMPDFKLHYIILLDVSFSLIGKHAAITPSRGRSLITDLLCAIQRL